jgi:hypothetical protein
MVEGAAAHNLTGLRVDCGEREQPPGVDERVYFAKARQQLVPIERCRFAGSRSSGSVNAGRSASMSSSRGRRRITSPSLSSSDGIARRGSDSWRLTARRTLASGRR